MLRIAICDDQIEYTQHIFNMIKRKPDMPNNLVCHVFDNSDTLINIHKNTPFDIIFLDIVMPLLNGIETAREIRRHDKDVKIVFLTSSQEYALESYAVKANNYLLKPIQEQAFYHCLDELLQDYLQQAQTITVRGTHAVQKVALDTIEYIEAQNKLIVFVKSDGTTLNTTEPLHLWEEKLSSYEDFVKCHRSYIVNINHIDTYTPKELLMHSGFRIPISRSYQSTFKETYFRVLFGKVGEAK